MSSLWVLSLLGAMGASGPFGGSTRVLLLPPPASAPEEVRLLSDAVAKRLRESQTLALVPEQRFKELLSGAESAVPNAGDLRPEIDASLKRVKDHYRALALGDAIRLLQELENSRLGLLGCPENIGLAARISFWLGVVHATTNQPERARERFGSALFIDPKMEIDRVYFPPDIVALFEEERSKLASRPTGGISVTTDPNGAQVYVDGRSSGAAPLTVSLPEGDHFICARRLGTRDWVARLRVVPGRVESQQIFLQRSGSDEFAAQLVALLTREGSIDLEDPAHVEAIGGIIGADVVAAVVAPGTLEFRSVGKPALGERLTHTTAGEVAAGAAELVTRLEKRLASAAASPATAPEAVRRFELSGLGAYGLTLGKGLQGGLALGAQLPLLGPVSLGARLSAAGSMASLVLAEQIPVGTPRAGTPPGVVSVSSLGELGAALELRWGFWQSKAWGAYVALGLEGRYLIFTNPVVVQPLPSATLDLRGAWLPVLALGPQAGLGATRAFSEGWEALAAAGYAAETTLARAELRVPAEAPNGTKLTVLFAPANPSPRHQISVNLGVARRF